MKKFNLIKPVVPAVLLCLSSPAKASQEDSFAKYSSESQTGRNSIEMTGSNYNTDPSSWTMIFFQELVLDGQRYSESGDHIGTAYGFGSIKEDKIDMQLKFVRTGSKKGNLIGNRVNGEWKFTITRTDVDGNVTAKPIVLNICRQTE